MRIGGLGERYYSDEEAHDSGEEDYAGPEDEDAFLANLKERQKKKAIPAVNHDMIRYEPYRKNFYIEVNEIAKMTEDEVRDYRQNDLEGLYLHSLVSVILFNFRN